METVKERTERKTGLDYELKIDTLPEELNGKPTPVTEQEEDDGYTYSMEELEALIEKTHQEKREGRTIPCNEAFFEEMDRMIARMGERERKEMEKQKAV